jgi:hypothetical protein
MAFWQRVFSERWPPPRIRGDLMFDGARAAAGYLSSPPLPFRTEIDPELERVRRLEHHDPPGRDRDLPAGFWIAGDALVFFAWPRLKPVSVLRYLPLVDH